MSYEYDPRALGKRRKAQPASTSVHQDELSTNSEEILFDFSEVQSSEKQNIPDQRDQDLDIWKILPKDDLVIEFGKC